MACQIRRQAGECLGQLVFGWRTGLGGHFAIDLEDNLFLKACLIFLQRFTSHVLFIMLSNSQRLDNCLIGKVAAGDPACGPSGTPSYSISAYCLRKCSMKSDMTSK